MKYANQQKASVGTRIQGEVTDVKSVALSDFRPNIGKKAVVSDTRFDDLHPAGKLKYWETSGEWLDRSSSSLARDISEKREVTPKSAATASSEPRWTWIYIIGGIAVAPLILVGVKMMNR